MTTQSGRRRTPGLILLRDGPFQGIEVPDTLPRIEPEVFIVARVNPATGVLERHEYGLVLDREASWMGAVEDKARPAGL